MSDRSIFKFNSNIEFANFGKDMIAYVRRVNTDDLDDTFTEEGELPLGQDIWALYSADGEPIALSDDKQMLFNNAEEFDLVTVNRH